MLKEKRATGPANQQKFNLYAGNGVYLAAMSHESVTQHSGRADGSTQTSFNEINALSMTRAEAVSACRMARKQGVNSWLVAA